jgi:hypothetical protein
MPFTSNYISASTHPIEMIFGGDEVNHFLEYRKGLLRVQSVLAWCKWGLHARSSSI